MFLQCKINRLNIECLFINQHIFYLYDLILNDCKHQYVYKYDLRITKIILERVLIIVFYAFLIDFISIMNV